MDILIKQAQEGDKTALEALWKQTKKFAFTVARRFYTTTYADMDDLQQCAYLGVHTAAMHHTGRYDFLALVRWCTLRECQKLLDLYGSRRQLRADSLDIILPDGESTPADLIEDESQPEIGAQIEESELVRDVRAAVVELPEREQLIIRRHWLDGLTLADVGKEIRLSSERVRQLEARAFDRLRADPILQTYCPRNAPSVYRSGLSSFRNTRASSVERAAMHSIQREEVKQKKAARSDGYMDLLESLAAEGFISADELHALLPSYGG